MSLYDDEDDMVKSSSLDTGWSIGRAAGGAAAKPSLPPAALNRLSRPPAHKAGSLTSPAPLAPVVNLQKNKRGGDSPKMGKARSSDKFRRDKSSSLATLRDPNWTPSNEYDPLWPNDYHKVLQDIRDSKRHLDQDEEPDSKKRRYTEVSRERARDRYSRGEDDDRSSSSSATSGFSRRPAASDDYSDDEDDRRRHHHHRSSSSGGRRSNGSRGPGGSSSGSAAGAAIAPPPSLTESSSNNDRDRGGGGGGGSNSADASPPNSNLQKMANTLAPPGGAMHGLGVAAKIMAKYGYKQGLGLGRNEQGMSMALSVEKTSKRGGRIVHEKDLMPPPPLFGESSATPPHAAPLEEDEVAAAVEAAEGEAEVEEGLEGEQSFGQEQPAGQEAEGEQAAASKTPITELMKNPSKVVLCKNMVGPGEVDDDLEPEVKEECHVKYGEVNRVIIFEIPNARPEEAVRIFIEFKRVESAIKAVVDLNGRFFGGREVQAGFYNVDKFDKLQLNG